MTAGPFMRWLGGKWKPSAFSVLHVPEVFGCYHEPMLGGGSMMLRLLDQGRITGDTLRAADLNPYLIRGWQAVAADVEAVKAHFLHHHVPKHSYGHFLEQRGRQIEMLQTKDVLEAGSWFLYMNRASYNGLWRARFDGRLNIPWGNKTLQSIQNFRKLDWAAGLMRQHRVGPECFRCLEASYSIPLAVAGDCVYADPPYVGTFTEYTAGGTADADHVKFATLCLEAWKRGVTVLVSQSEQAARLYERVWLDVPKNRLTRVEIRVQRRVSQKVSSRGYVTELLYVLEGGTQ